MMQAMAENTGSANPLVEMMKNQYKTALEQLKQSLNMPNLSEEDKTRIWQGIEQIQEIIKKIEAGENLK